MAETPAGQIVAMGGGGFSAGPDNTLLDDFVLSLARRTPARVCFLPTAAGDSANYVAKFYRAFAGRATPTDLTLFGGPLPRHPPRTSDLEGFVKSQDIFYVGGGNTVHLLAIWRAHGLDRLLREAWYSGAVLTGISAGMICWFAASITDSFGAVDPLQDGLALLDASACPHYDSEPGRRPTFHRAIEGGLPPGYAADDGAALHFVGNDFTEAVSARPGALAYRVELRDGAAVEEALPTRFLGA